MREIWESFGGFTRNRTVVMCLQNCEKQPFGIVLSVWPSVCPSTWNNSSPTGWSFVKFDDLVFMTNLSRKFQLMKIWKEWRVFYMETKIYFLFHLTHFFLEWEMFRPPLWSSGQSFWLQIQRSLVLFPALPDFLSSSGSGTGSTQPREVNWGATWIKSSGSGPENRD